MSTVMHLTTYRAAWSDIGRPRRGSLSKRASLQLINIHVIVNKLLIFKCMLETSHLFVVRSFVNLNRNLYFFKKKSIHAWYWCPARVFQFPARKNFWKNKPETRVLEIEICSTNCFWFCFPEDIFSALNSFQ